MKFARVYNQVSQFQAHFVKKPNTPQSNLSTETNWTNLMYEKILF